MTKSEPWPWPWPDSLEATAAAPESHRVVFENDEVRVLEVELPPGHREPEHTHREASVMMVLDPAKIRYFVEGELVFESSDDEQRGPRPPRWMDPEGPHAVENIDDHSYRAFRVELKRRCVTSQPTLGGATPGNI